MDTVIIIHHNDRDGIMSATLAYMYFDSLPEMYNIEFISANYSKSITEMINQRVKISSDIAEIWILDYSLQENNEEEFLELADKYKVTWIDHHATSIMHMLKNEEINDKLSKLDGLRVIGFAGCALTYIYTRFLKSVNTNDLNMLLESSNPYLYSLHTTLKYMFSDTMSKVDPKVALAVLHRLNTPPIIVYAHRYDIFDLDDKVINFNYGECNTYPDNGIVIDEIINSKNVDEYIEKGKIVRKYIENRDKENVEENGFEVKLEFTDLSKRGKRDEKIYTIFSMNTEHFSSFAFGDKMDKYDICMPFKFNGTDFTYSMYTNKDNIDCGMLCSLLGGGGHPKAGGFTSDCIIIDSKFTFALTKL